MRAAALAATAALLASLAALPARADATPAACQAGATFPGEEWTSVADQVRRARPAEVAALDAYAFTLTGPDAAREGHRTDGLVVVHRGVITYERYARGFGPSR